MYYNKNDIKQIVNSKLIICINIEYYFFIIQMDLIFFYWVDYYFEVGYFIFIIEITDFSKFIKYSPM